MIQTNYINDSVTLTLSSPSAKFKFDIHDFVHTKYVTIVCTKSNGIVDYFVNDCVLQADYGYTSEDKFGVQKVSIALSWLKSGENLFIIKLKKCEDFVCDVTISISTSEDLRIYDSSTDISDCRFTNIETTADYRPGNRYKNLEERVLLYSTRQHVIKKLRQIADEIDMQFDNIRDAQAKGKLIKFAGEFPSIVCSVLDNSNVYEECSVYNTGEGVVGVRADISEPINIFLSIKKARAIFDHDQILTNSIHNHMTKLQEYSINNPGPVTDYLLRRDTETSCESSSNNDMIGIYNNYFSGKATSVIELEEFIQKISAISNKDPTVTAQNLRSLAQIIENKLILITDQLYTCYKNLLQEIDQVLRSDDSERLKNYLTNVSFLNGFMGLDLGQFSNEYDRYLGTAFSKNVKELWSEMDSRLFTMNADKPIDIIVIAHGTVGSPKDIDTNGQPTRPTSFTKSHPQHLLFSTDNPRMSVIFYQPWGVRIGPIDVERIVKSTINWAEQCKFYYENTNTYIPPEYMHQMLEKWNVMTSANRTHEVIRTVWMNYIEENTPPYSDLNMDVINATASPNQIIYRYNFKDPLPLMFFTRCVMFVMDIIEEDRNIQLTVNVHWAACLELSPSDLNAAIEMDQLSV